MPKERDCFKCGAKGFTGRAALAAPDRKIAKKGREWFCASCWDQAPAPEPAPRMERCCDGCDAVGYMGTKNYDVLRVHKDAQSGNHFCDQCWEKYAGSGWPECSSCGTVCCNTFGTSSWYPNPPRVFYVVVYSDGSVSCPECAGVERDGGSDGRNGGVEAAVAGIGVGEAEAVGGEVVQAGTKRRTPATPNQITKTAGRKARTVAMWGKRP
eukprot:gene3023-7080_t